MTGSPVRTALAEGRIGGGAWAIADQALYAGANFALNVALARALTPEAYGAFTTAFIAFLLLGAVHGGLLIEPVLVFGAGRLAPRRAEYLRWALGAHVRVAAVIGLVLAGAGGIAWLAGYPVLGAAGIGFGVAQAGILLHWLLRRACHLSGRTASAALSGALYLALVLAGAAALSGAGALSALTAPLLMGAASLAAGGALMIRLGVRPAGAGAMVGRAAGAAHRAYGRYAAGSGLLEWAQGALPFLVVPLFAGLDGAAQLRAVYNLAMPALQAGAAITVMCVPLFVAARRRGELRPAAVNTGLALVGGAVAYGLLVGTFGDVAMVWMYAGAYTAGPALRWTMAALPVASVLAGLLVAVLRAAERPDAVLGARLMAVSAGGVLAVALAASAGVAGAVGAAVATLLMEFVLLAGHLRRGAAGRVVRAGGQPVLVP